MNLVICVSGVGARAGFSALVVDAFPNLHTIDSGQSFPLYLYEPTTRSDDELFEPTTQSPGTQYSRRDGIGDGGLAHFQSSYPAKGEGSGIRKKDLFHYIYGLLHSPEYRARYKKT